MYRAELGETGLGVGVAPAHGRSGGRSLAGPALRVLPQMWAPAPGGHLPPFFLWRPQPK